MAGTDQVDIMFKGVGGHGSMPQMAKDPVLMAAMAVVRIRGISPPYLTKAAKGLPPLTVRGLPLN